MSNTTLVNVDADTSAKLVEFISVITANKDLKETCAKYIEANTGKPLLLSLLTPNVTTVLFDKLSDAEEDILGVYQGMMALMLMYACEDGEIVTAFTSSLSTLPASLSSLPTPKEGEEVSAEIVALQQQYTQTTKQRLSILITLFNMLSKGALKYELLLQIITFAQKTDQVSEIAHYYTYVMDWIKEWQLDTNKQQELSLVFFTLLRATSTTTTTTTTPLVEKSNIFMYHYLSTYTKLQALPSPEAIKYAKAALIEALQAPVGSFELRENLLSILTDIQVHAIDPIDKLYKILHIISTGTLTEFRSFVAVNAKSLSSNNVDANDLERKVRLIMLSALANGRDAITYQEVADALSVDYSDVESWVVQAVAQGVFECGMDQINEIITIKKTCQTLFTKTQWEGVHEKLGGLQETLAGLVSELKLTMTN